MKTTPYKFRHGKVRQVKDIRRRKPNNNKKKAEMV